jgi:uncharacterized protein YqfB (UPF0267 family)
MIFSADLAALVVAGKKTVTRRPRTGSNPSGEPGGWVDDPCRYKAGRTYAVQPGRGKKAIGRIYVRSVRPELMTQLDDDEARLEGFKNTREFTDKWLAIYGKGSWLDIVWRIEFELVEAAR